MPLSTILLIVLGFAGLVYSQSVITTTTTRLVTVQPTTYITETTISGTTIVATLQIPSYTLLMEVRSPDQTCTVTFTAQTPPAAITIPGTTIAVPGTTISTVFTVQSIETTMTEVEGGTTVTTTGFEMLPIVTEGLTLTMPVYGVGSEFCDQITVTNIVTYMVDSVPATIIIAFEGISTTFGGTTISMEFPELDLTTTMLRTNTGVTERFTTRFPGTFYTTTQTIQPTTIRETVVRSGTTSTELITIIMTLPQTITTTPTTPGLTTTKLPTIKQTPAGQSPAMWLGITILAVLLVVAVALAAVVIRIRH
ncbi:MAG: hypothetical protein QXV62_03775 [Nitrososphaerota archaeon]